MQRLFPIGVAIAWSLALATLFFAVRGHPAIKRPARAFRHALAEAIDEVSDKVEEALE